MTGSLSQSDKGVRNMKIDERDFLEQLKFDKLLLRLRLVITVRFKGLDQRTQSND
jgi:hypothetical protein